MSSESISKHDQLFKHSVSFLQRLLLSSLLTFSRTHLTPSSRHTNYLYNILIILASEITTSYITWLLSSHQFPLPLNISPLSLSSPTISIILNHPAVGYYYPDIVYYLVYFVVVMQRGRRESC